MTDLLTFAERYGIALGLLVMAVAGAVSGRWFSKPMVERIQAGFERLLVSKEADNKLLLEHKDKEIAYREAEIQRLREANEHLTSLLLESQERAKEFADLAGAPRSPVTARRTTR